MPLWAICITGLATGVLIASIDNMLRNRRIQKAVEDIIDDMKRNQC